MPWTEGRTHSQNGGRWHRLWDVAETATPWRPQSELKRTICRRYRPGAALYTPPMSRKTPPTTTPVQDRPRKKPKAPPTGPTDPPPLVPEVLTVPSADALAIRTMRPDGPTPTLPAGVQRPDVVAAIEQGQWLLLVPHASESEAVNALLDGIRTVLDEDARSVGALQWSSVLRAAGISWIAWTAMRETPAGRAVWAVWGAALSDLAVGEARLAARTATDRDSASVAQARLALARWVAQRMDRSYSDAVTGNLSVTAPAKITIVVRNEITPSTAEP
jgi:hypothetical protein